jgi:ribokinase
MDEGRVVVLGSINLDIQLYVTDLPTPGETVRCTNIRRGLGGKGANQAVAAARAGAATKFIGAVGEDKTIIDTLRATVPSLDLGGVTSIHGCETGQAYISVSGSGENQIVIVGGANERLSDHGNAQLTPQDVCLAQLEVPIAAIAGFFAAAERAGAMTVLNAAPASDDARSLIERVDILIVNETELAHFSHLASLSTHDIGAVMAAAQHLRHRSAQVIIVTLGAHGVLVVGDECTHLPSRRVTAVDTTGAGDCFCGVLCAALADGQDVLAATLQANAAASLQVEREGTADAMPWRADIDAIHERPTPVRY